MMECRDGYAQLAYQVDASLDQVANRIHPQPSLSVPKFGVYVDLEFAMFQFNPFKWACRASMWQQARWKNGAWINDDPDARYQGEAWNIKPNGNSWMQDYPGQSDVAEDFLSYFRAQAICLSPQVPSGAILATVDYRVHKVGTPTWVFNRQQKVTFKFKGSCGGSNVYGPGVVSPPVDLNYIDP
jgi:hypothetical protein